MDDKYTVTIFVAAPGTPLLAGGHPAPATYTTKWHMARTR